jgi:hypothetical protein
MKRGRARQSGPIKTVTAESSEDAKMNGAFLVQFLRHLRLFAAIIL